MALKQFVVDQSGNGFRIDELIQRYLPELDGEQIREAFLHRDVKLDKVRVQKNIRAFQGQTISVYYMEKEDHQNPYTVYEDEDVIIVNKPSGISVEKDKGPGIALTELIEKYTGKPVYACHRLDNKTSGLCVLAKNIHALDILTDVFRERTLVKNYVCLVRGIMKPQEATCKAWLIKDPAAGRVTVLDHPAREAKMIVTEYKTIENGPVSRLNVHLITGRTHQIRAHLAALGHPILGDDVYGDRLYNREHKQHSLKLCAVYLKLDTKGKLPKIDGKEFEINAPF